MHISRGQICLYICQGYLGSVRIRMSGGCQTSGDMRCHTCYLHVQDVCWVIMPWDVRIFSDTSEHRRDVLSQDIRMQQILQHKHGGTQMRCIPQYLAVEMHADVGRIRRRCNVHGGKTSLIITCIMLNIPRAASCRCPYTGNP